MSCSNQPLSDNNENEYQQSAGYLEAKKTKEERFKNKRKQECNDNLEKNFKNIINNDNKYLASSKKKIMKWKSNKKEDEIIEKMNKLIEYLTFNYDNSKCDISRKNIKLAIKKITNKLKVLLKN